jgi:CO/xanthine dehydrogenase FAD-binding subunit
VILGAASFEVERPRNVKEALSLLADGLAESRPYVPMAGGTDLFVGLNAGQAIGTRFLDLWELDELRTVDRNGRTLVIGAITTYTELLESKDVARLLPTLQQAAREIGGIQIQNRGTLAGNIGNGSPAADAVPVLMAACARVVLASKRGVREVPLDQYYLGYRKTVRRADELIVRIRVDVPKGPQLFRKVGTRAAQAISKVALARVGNQVSLGSVAPTVIRARNLEAYLDEDGRDPEEAARRVLADIAPIDDVRSSADYRRRVAANLARELVARG